MTILNLTKTPQSTKSIIRPMSLRISLLFFGLPAFTFVVGFHVIMPTLIAGGMLSFYAYSVGCGIPLVGMLVASLIAYRWEGNPLRWSALKIRFRLYQMDGKSWLWVIGILVLSLMGFGLFSQIESGLINIGIMPLPASLPAFLDPRNSVSSLLALDEAFGGLKGNWIGLAAFGVLLFFNIIGEEFWWRGYILPRQELVFRKWTWVVHGVLWACFHFFKWWDIIALLPMTLALAFMVCRLKNTTTGIVVHSIFNGLGALGILMGVLGLVN